MVRARPEPRALHHPRAPQGGALGLSHHYDLDLTKVLGTASKRGCRTARRGEIDGFR